MTIKEVAKRANVSIGTVDRVIHRRGRVSRETAEKVRKVIEQTGYRPNIFARRLSLSKDYVFAVLMPILSQDSKYWEVSAKGIDKAAEELKTYKVRVNYFFYDRYSEESAKEAIKEIKNSNPDGILIAPVLHKPIKKFIMELPESIPYVLFNANIPDSYALCYIGQDSFQSGVVSARLMKTLIKEKGSIATIIAAPDDYHIVERTDGFQSFFENENDIIIRNYELYNCNEETFRILMERIFEENPDLEGIFVANAATHFAAEYIKEKNIGRKIGIIGYDLIEENVSLLKEGYIDFLISQKAETQGYEGIYALYKHVVLQQPCKRNIMMPIDIITSENLIYYQRF